ncbi:response regulator [Roseobacter ponti]|uniref:histidine kinase n=1 Tax=Roseobacter ponti TaxID=1891787 RepID=A0A858SLN8_9RHOB|nr:response regulator [Roseobacter ponti]QJF49819.1 response regulator [Roseobacter ponti]
MSLANKMAEERRRRLAAERLLELKQAELFAANRKLGQHARNLSDQIVETRAEVATVRDENQRVKSDLTAAQEKIERVERRLWHSIGTIKDGFAFFSPDLELIMANPSYLAVFDRLEEIRPGVSYVTILQVLTDEGIVNTGDLSPVAWRQLMIDRVQSPDPAPQVIRLWNGQYIKMLDQRGPDGDIISLGLNITETVAYEKKLKSARHSAESANRAKSTFLANMSHELRTPMNGVVGMADLLAEGDLSEEQQLYVETIKRSGEALLVIINDVLDYSKIEAERLDLHPEPFDLENAVHDVMTLLQTSAQEKGLRLCVDYQMEIASRVVGDPGRIRQVLTNLLGNAVKFTSSGHVLVRVKGTPTPDDAALDLTITVEDTGIGIPEELIDHVFGEFNQVENERNRQFDGTGLGLAITQRLISMMGGKVWLTSQEGVGSCFGFDLRMATDGPAILPAADLPATLQHVLVTGRDWAGRDIIRRHLEETGLKVTMGEDAGSAQAAMQADISLVIADHTDGISDGFEVARALRDAGHHTPVLLLCGNAGLARRNADRDAVDTIMQRPFLRADLIRWLCEAEARVAREVTPIPGFRHRAAPDNPAQSVPEQRDAGDKTGTGLMRILAAEDNRTNRLVFSKMLKSLNIDLKFACDGQEAVDMWKEFRPDLIFMDISMPRLDGKEAARQIRGMEEETGERVPIVALTAHAMAGDEKEILDAGLDHYMTKPLRKPAIISRILAHCPDGVRAPVDEPDQAAG